MPKFKFTLCRAAVIDEYYEIEADSEEEALSLAYDGNLGEPVRTEFVDWRDDEYSAVDCEDIDPLYRMVKDYKSVDSLSN
jgi:hypothetical protein